VRDFFEALGSTMTVQEFEPLSYTAHDSEVLTVVHHKATRIANGKVVDMNLHHLFRFPDGKIAYCRAGEDPAQTEAAFRD
jgi:ketosteroid isomerase-like protein